MKKLCSFVDQTVPNPSNVAEQMSETLKLIESLGIERTLIEGRTIKRHCTIQSPNHRGSSMAAIPKSATTEIYFK